MSAGRTNEAEARKAFKHPLPREVAIGHCPACSRVTFARHVNQESSAPRRYCGHCGEVLEVAIYGSPRPLR